MDFEFRHYAGHCRPVTSKVCLETADHATHSYGFLESSGAPKRASAVTELVGSTAKTTELNRFLFDGVYHRAACLRPRFAVWFQQRGRLRSCPQQVGSIRRGLRILPKTYAWKGTEVRIVNGSSRNRRREYHYRLNKLQRP